MQLRWPSHVVRLFPCPTISGFSIKRSDFVTPLVLFFPLPLTELVTRTAPPSLFPFLPLFQNLPKRVVVFPLQPALPPTADSRSHVASVSLPTHVSRNVPFRLWGMRLSLPPRFGCSFPTTRVLRRVALTPLSTRQPGDPSSPGGFFLRPGMLIRARLRRTSAGKPSGGRIPQNLPSPFSPSSPPRSSLPGSDIASLRSLEVEYSVWRYVI